MLETVTGRWQAHRLAKKIDSARRRGEGLYVGRWDGPQDQPAIDLILSWCRDVLAGCRRPFGIDLFELAVSYRCEEQSQKTVMRLHPADLYDEGLAHALTAFLFGEQATRRPEYVTATVFSWGDAAHRYLPRD